MLLTNKKLLTIWFFGFMSGFTVMISSYTLNYWLSEENINLKTIGMFSLISLPYAINFIWAPIFDATRLPYLSSRYQGKVGWVIMMQLMLGICVYLVSECDPLKNIISIALLGFMVSFFASAQDTILGALRTEIVAKIQQGEISGIYIFGYRIGMLISSSGAVFTSQFTSWQNIYIIFSIVIISFPLILLLMFNPDLPIFNNSDLKKPNYQLSTKGLKRFITQILEPIGSIRYLIIVVVLLIMYRLPDNFISIMITPFLHEIGYQAFEISTAGKLFGAISAMVGGLIASHVMKNKTITSSMLLFGIIHALAHLLYIYQYFYGKDIRVLYLITGVEGITGGMTMAAYIAFIASLCSGKFRATQYAFFSSMMGFSRSIFPSISGYIVLSYGWSIFYVFCIIATIPALILITILNQFSNSREY